MSNILLALAIVFTLTTCSNGTTGGGGGKKPDPKTNPGPEEPDTTLGGPGVYTAGYYTVGSKEIACLWKDGVKTDLYTRAGNSFAVAVVVVELKEEKMAKTMNIKINDKYSREKKPQA